jgi:hypothetical protein
VRAPCACSRALPSGVRAGYAATVYVPSTMDMASNEYLVGAELMTIVTLLVSSVMRFACMGLLSATVAEEEQFV